MATASPAIAERICFVDFILAVRDARVDTIAAFLCYQNAANSMSRPCKTIRYKELEIF